MIIRRTWLSTTRACLKKAFRELRVSVCGRFYPNESGVASYGNRMRVKYTAKWGLQIAEMIFQTRSRISWIAIRPRYPVLLHFWHPIPRFTLRISAPIRIRSRSVVSLLFRQKVQDSLPHLSPVYLHCCLLQQSSLPVTDC